MQPANAPLMKRMNRQTILNTVRRLGPISRAELSARTGLSQPAVTAIVRELMQLDMVREVGQGQSSGGRPPVMLLFNEAAQVVLGASLEGESIRGAVADLNGSLLHETAVPLQATGGERPEETLSRFLHDLIQAGSSRPAAIAVGVPGITHTGQGTVSHAPALGWWQDVPLRSMLEQQFGVPVTIENDVNLMTLGEQAQGAGQEVQNLALMHVGEGIGAGILLNGGLYRGFRDAAGEVGYLPLGPAIARAPGDFGLFEQHYSASGLVRRIAKMPDAPPAERIAHPVRLLREYAVMEIAWARALWDDTLRHWAYAMAAIACVINPERIILAGHAVESGAEGLEQMRSILASLVPVPPDIRFGTLEGRAVLLGAITNALQVTYQDSFGNPTG